MSLSQPSKTILVEPIEAAKAAPPPDKPAIAPAPEPAQR
jgi:hypothetical protein